MDSLKAVYKILKGFEEQLDNKQFDDSFLKELEISETKKEKLLMSMLEEKLITGISSICSKTGMGFKYIDPRITIYGLTYLQDNSAMRKMAEVIKTAGAIKPF